MTDGLGIVREEIDAITKIAPWRSVQAVPYYNQSALLDSVLQYLLCSKTGAYPYLRFVSHLESHCSFDKTRNPGRGTSQFGPTPAESISGGPAGFPLDFRDLGN